MRRVDEDFRALPLDRLADAALERARSLGAEHADLRVDRVRDATTALKDGRLTAATDGTSTGLAVRVVVDGAWGFAATAELTAEAADETARRAVELARVSRALVGDPVALAEEPVHTGEWVSSYEVDPFDVPVADQVALLAERSSLLLAVEGIEHADAGWRAVKEQKHYADLAGTRTTQQRVRVQPTLVAVALTPDGSDVEDMSTLAPPAGRGWEYATGADGAWDWDGELSELPALVLEKLASPSVEAGRYDLVVDPSNLWLTIHESVGHATELDRALGYEAAYAGTSFATLDQLGALRYGSDLMHVTGDRTAEHGLASTGWDDEGVQTQTWDLVRGGVLVGYQLDRHMAAKEGLPAPPGRSNGCAYADAWSHAPVQRMANVSLQPAADGPDLAGVLAQVDRGIYVVGDKSWSIDMQRYNFQFTGQRFYRIEGGRLAGQVRDVAYQATTTEFWGSLAALGGPSTYVLGGAFNCGKAQPGQVAPVSHGCPVALFRDVRVLNTAEEGS